MAMPWTRAKSKAAAIRADTTGRMLADLNRLFDACFRIQKEASIAAGRHIPMVVENVRGAVPWVGRSRWNFGSFHLWGDVPALMPWGKAVKNPGLDWSAHADPDYRSSGKGACFRDSAIKNTGGKGVPHRTAGHWTNPAEHEGHKMARQWWSNGEDALSAKASSSSPRRKEASALIAKIPLTLSRHIARAYF